MSIRKNAAIITHLAGISTHIDAQAALQEKQRGVVLEETARQTVGQFLVDWWENSQKQNVRVRTYERSEEIERLHVGFHGRGLSQCAAQSVRYSCEKGAVSRNVCDLISPPHAEGFETQPLTIEQAHLLLAAARDHGWKPFLLSFQQTA